MKKCREGSIIYIDERFIHVSYTNAKVWNDNTEEGLKQPISKRQRLIIVNAGDESNFVPNASFNQWNEFQWLLKMAWGKAST